MPSTTPPRYPFFCDDCVPRGCSCNGEYTPTSEEAQLNGYGENPPSHKFWKWVREGIYWEPTDDQGRSLPCVEFFYDEEGYDSNLEDIDFFTKNGIKYHLSKD